MFAVGVRRSAALLDKTHRRNQPVSVHRGIAVAVAGVGIYGQLHDSAIGFIPGVAFNVHTLFGTLLCVAILARFRWERQRIPVDKETRIDCVRSMSRCVYLLLYGLLGVREIANLAAYAGNGGIFHFGGWQMGRQGSGVSPLLRPIDAFQAYVAYGLLALILIRVLAAVNGENLRPKTPTG